MVISLLTTAAKITSIATLFTPNAFGGPAFFFFFFDTYRAPFDRLFLSISEFLFLDSKFSAREQDGLRRSALTPNFTRCGVGRPEFVYLFHISRSYFPAHQLIPFISFSPTNLFYHASHNSGQIDRIGNPV